MTALPAPYDGGALEPSAIASPLSIATTSVGEIIKNLVQHSQGFHSENQTDAAMSSVDKWVAHSVGDEASAIDRSEVRAPKEDVSLRVPPGGYVPATVLAGPILDYTKLAQAILAEQARLQGNKEVTDAQ
jgi:hypothetical protein